MALGALGSCSLGLVGPARFPSFLLGMRNIPECTAPPGSCLCSLQGAFSQATVRKPFSSILSFQNPCNVISGSSQAPWPQGLLNDPRNGAGWAAAVHGCLVCSAAQGAPLPHPVGLGAAFKPSKVLGMGAAPKKNLIPKRHPGSENGVVFPAQLCSGCFALCFHFRRSRPVYKKAWPVFGQHLLYR